MGIAKQVHGADHRGTLRCVDGRTCISLFLSKPIQSSGRLAGAGSGVFLANTRARALSHSGKHGCGGIHLLEPASVKRSSTVIHQSGEYQNTAPTLARLRHFGELRGSIISSLQPGDSRGKRETPNGLLSPV